MKGVEVEEFRDVEVYPDEELFVVVVRKNFKLWLDRQRGQVVSTQDPVVSTQCSKYKAKWSSSVDTRSGSVDTRDPSQNTFWANLGQCVDTRSSSVDTRGLPRTPFELIWDSVSTLAQVVSTLEALPEQNL
ncbi:hypothetical protein Taro_034766 [Colocasia esculenta]|uniref:Uncharacterized protein n=1 Tax=Colocasia esculenta TaxID=4460 RepID=A0A843W4V7_COLES|nr:hypothetical protein [Colocasia esculenta]